MAVDRVKTRLMYLAASSGMPGITQDTHRFDKFVVRKGTEVAFATAQEWVGDTEAPFLTFVGEPGTGKTHLALAIGWEFVEQGVTTRYAQAESLLDDLRQRMNDHTLSRNIDYLMTVPLLIIDDLGAEQSTPWARAKLLSIIDHRYVNGYLTVITTNLPPARLESRITSRLKEGLVVTLKCDDYRDIKGSQRMSGNRPS